MRSTRMKMNPFILILVLFLSMFSLTAFSQEDQFEFQEILARGTGCPKGTTSVTTSPDSQSVSLIFDELMAEVPQYSEDNDNNDSGEVDRRKDNPRLDHKVCNIIIKAKIKPGERVDNLEVSVDFRGATLVEVGSFAKFKSQLLGFKGPRAKRKKSKKNILINEKWDLPIDEDWILNESMTIPITTKCSVKKEKDVQIILKNTLIAKMGKKFDPDDSTAFLVLDSADLAGSLKIKLTTRLCKSPKSPKCKKNQRWNKKRETCVSKNKKPGRRPKLRGRKCGPKKVWHPRKKKCVKRRHG